MSENCWNTRCWNQALGRRERGEFACSFINLAICTLLYSVYYFYPLMRSFCHLMVYGLIMFWCLKFIEWLCTVFALILKAQDNNGNIGGLISYFSLSMVNSLFSGWLSYLQQTARVLFFFSFLGRNYQLHR